MSTIASADTDQGEEIAFGDDQSRRIAGWKLVGGVFAIGMALYFSLSNLALKPVISIPLLFSVLGLLLWLTHGWFFKGAQQGQISSFMVDREGITANKSGAGPDRVKWARVKSARIDARAVIVRFEPRNLQSDKPEDRISQFRLATPKNAPQEILAAINRFWTPPGEAAHPD